MKKMTFAEKATLIGVLLTAIATAATAFISFQSLKLQERMSSPELGFQGFYGDSGHLSYVMQSKFYGWETVNQVNGKQLVVAVTNDGGVPVTLTDVGAYDYHRSITVNNMVVPVTVNPHETKWFNTQQQEIVSQLKGLKVFGPSGKWTIAYSKISVQP